MSNNVNNVIEIIKEPLLKEFNFLNDTLEILAEIIIMSNYKYDVATKNLRELADLETMSDESKKTLFSQLKRVLISTWPEYNGVIQKMKLNL